MLIVIDAQLNSPVYLIVVCYYKLNNTQVCDEHLFGQVSTHTAPGRYQLPIFSCSIRKDTLASV